nr:unnamed protein product [Callosobruchus chinensis]
MKVTVEALRRKTGPGQCYRCQQFGHSQLCCRGAVRCVRCAGAHRHQSAKFQPVNRQSAQTAGTTPRKLWRLPRRKPNQRQGVSQKTKQGKPS